MQPDDQALSKALALIERTRHRLQQIDSTVFPTDETRIARDLLIESLDRLGAVENWKSRSPKTNQPPVSPQALYRAIIDLQEFVASVEASNLDRISWPVVSYCRGLWEALFPITADKSPHLFYSAQSRHNYSIGSFDAHLGQLLRPVLGSENEVSSFFGASPLLGAALFCLSIPVVEDQNLPLYANIGHEFGHAFLKNHEIEFDKLWREDFGDFWKETVKRFPAVGERTIAQRLTQAFECLAVELFCDRVGAAISGPAFLLSLQEMLWGSDPKLWQVNLRPELSNIAAYPGDAFRIECLSEAESLRSLPQFIADVRRHLDQEWPHQLPLGLPGQSAPSDSMNLDAVFATAAEKPDGERVEVVPAGDGHASLFREVFEAVLPELREKLQGFAKRCEKELLSPVLGNFPPVRAEDVASLLVRLRHDVLPNIVPDGTLRGVPAQFSTILNASAIYRACLLSQRPADDGPATIDRHLQKVERLTAKALEVTYLQHDYNQNFPSHRP